MRERVTAQPRYAARLNKLRLRELVLLVLLIALCIQNVKLLSIGDRALKPFHVMIVAAVLIALVYRGGKFSFISPVFVAILAYVVVSGAINAYRFGFDSLLFKYIIYFILILATYNLGQGLSLERWEHLIRLAAALVLAAVCINLASQYQALLTYAKDTSRGHPHIATIFGGGINLESTWLALFIVFFERNVKGALYSAFALLYSLLVSSRTGMIVCVLGIVYVLLLKDYKNKANAVVVAMILGLIGFISLITIFGGDIVQRFTEIGSEEGSLARLRLWTTAPDVFALSPFIGVGAGNAVPMMGRVTGLAFYEDNVHNYALQTFIEFGAIGEVILVSLVCVLLVSVFQDKFQNSLGVYLVVFAMASMLQFAGADAICGYMIGAYLAVCKTRRNATVDAKVVQGCIGRKA